MAASLPAQCRMCLWSMHRKFGITDVVGAFICRKCLDIACEKLVATGMTEDEIMAMLNPPVDGDIPS